MTSIAVIPAKGTSRRVPGKNTRLFAGHPMLSYPIRAAKQSRLFDHIVVSSDSPEVLAIAEGLGVTPKHRPLNLTLEHIGPLEVAQSVLRGWQEPVHRVCIIYATACMLEAEDLLRGSRYLRKHAYALSVNSDPAKPLQDAAMFIWCTAAALGQGMPLFTTSTALIPIPKERVIDINTPEDWKEAERMYGELHGEELCA